MVPRGLLILFLLETTVSKIGVGEVVNIRHGRSRSHLARPNHLSDSLTSVTLGPPETTEGSEDSRHHPKDDAEDLVEPSAPPNPLGPQVDVVTRFLRIVESQQQLGDNCTAGTGLNLGEGVVDRYAQVSSSMFREVGTCVSVYRK